MKICNIFGWEIDHKPVFISNYININVAELLYTGLFIKYHYSYWHTTNTHITVAKHVYGLSQAQRLKKTCAHKFQKKKERLFWWILWHTNTAQIIQCQRYIWNCVQYMEINRNNTGMNSDYWSLLVTFYSMQMPLLSCPKLRQDKHDKQRLQSCYSNPRSTQGKNDYTL